MARFNAAQKAEYRVKMKDEIERYTEELAKGVEATKTSEGFQEMLRTMAQFPSYSFKNIVMILMQNPEATQVASFNFWKKQGRFVKKGEKALKIWAPLTKKVEIENKDGETGTVQRLRGFKLVSVFDVAQTEGKPLPEVVHRLTGTVDDFALMFEAIKSVSGYKVLFEDVPDANGYYSSTLNQIIIKNGLEEAQQIKTLIHETAHIWLHGGEGCGKSRKQREIEAESVAYLVCRHFGIASGDYSFPYIATWAEDIGTDEYTKVIEEIRVEASALIEAVEERLKKARQVVQ